SISRRPHVGQTPSRRRHEIRFRRDSEGCARMRVARLIAGQENRMTTIQITGTGTATGTRIHNPRALVAARLAWLVVFGVSLTMFILSIPYHFSEMHTLCTSGPCYAPALTPAILERLQQAGLSTDFYAGYWAFLEFLIAGPFALTSLILFSRRSDDR